MTGNYQPPQRCTCAECRELDALPVRLHGWPGAWQMRLFAEPPRIPNTRRKPK